VSKNVSFLVFTTLFTALCGAAWTYTGSFLPPAGDASIWFYGGLFALLVAKFIIEYRFTQPNDVIVNCLAAFVAISTLNSPPNQLWWEILRWSALGFAVVSLLLAWDHGREVKLAQSPGRTFVYRLVTRLGSAEVLFSFVFLLGLVSYTDLQQASDKVFVAIWGAILLATKLGLGTWPSTLAMGRRPKREIIGMTHSFLSPNVVYCRKLVARAVKAHELVAFAASGRGSPDCFGMVIDEMPSATDTLVTVALLHRSVSDACLSHDSILVSLSSDDLAKARESLGAAYPDNAAKIVGTVAEGTRISQLRFEVFGSPSIFAGSLLAVDADQKPVFYQVFEGVIEEEPTLKESTRAFVEGEAEQIGTWNAELGGFETHNWVAAQRSLVRNVDMDVAPPAYQLKADEITIGTIPNSHYPANIDVSDLVLFHTGILGVTGSGKSFLAYNLIEECAQRGIKVVCVDPTGDYQRHLADAALLPTLGHLKNFLDSTDHFIGIIEPTPGQQHPIEQTKRLSQACLDWCAAKRTDDDVLHPKPKVLVVLEEAHLLVPEWNFNPQRNLQDIVSATSQIVLQARKYGLGFLVISQRTANVVKSVLNQCNTIISFQAFDETGFDFLKNYMGSYHVRSLPNLKQRHGIVVGKASLSHRPVMVRFNDQERHLREHPAEPMPQPPPAQAEGGQVGK
jgi:uncharacterized protein